MNPRKIKVLLYPSEFSLHSAHKTLISNPPEGYEFIYSYNNNSIFEKIKDYPRIKKVSSFILNLFRLDLSKKIIKKEVHEDTDLVLSLGVIYNGSKPWILDILDNPYSLAGYNYNLFINNKKEIEKKLLNDNCKAIICENESSIRLMEKHFSKFLMNKVRLIRPGIQLPQKILKPRIKNIFQILFMGSTKNPDDFYLKGGVETLSSFNILCKKYSNLRLVVRCNVPPDIKLSMAENPKIRLIENRLSDEELVELYLSSKVLSSPSHVYMLMSWLESMSWGLPIIALDTYASRDYVKNNVNGFLISPSKNIPYDDPAYPVNVRRPEFIGAIKRGDPSIISKLCVAFEKIINNMELRKKIISNNLLTVNKKFSIKVRNEKLENVLNSAFKYSK